MALVSLPELVSWTCLIIGTQGSAEKTERLYGWIVERNTHLVERHVPCRTTQAAAAVSPTLSCNESATTQHSHDLA